jgi:twinkle protein
MNSISELKNELLANIDTVVKHLLPNGKQVSSEWRAGSVGGEEGKSLGVSMSGNKRGIWCDFSSNESGDLLDLWCSCREVSFVEALKETADFVGFNYEPKKVLQPQKKYKRPKRPNVSNLSEKALNWFKARCVTPDTLKKFKVAEENGNIAFPYISPEGELERVKFRAMNEKKIWSSKDSMPCLMGWQAIQDDDRYVVICEGEIDALTYSQEGVPCLSVPFGGGAGNKQAWIEYEFDRLDRFEIIYLSFDNDEAGELGKIECLNRLGRDRCRVIELPMKDANEILMKGISFDFHQAVKDAKSIDPEELSKLSDFHGDVMDLFYPPENADLGMKMPWSKTHDEVRFRLGEVSLWAGVNSHGKSVLLSNVVVDAVSQGYKFCIASLEMTPARQLEKMYRQITCMERPSPAYAKKAQQFIDDKIWIFNVIGRAKGERILDVFDYAHKRYGITHFIIDSLSKCGLREDDYSAQKDYVDVLMEFARTRMVHIHLVLHMRKTESESKMAGKFDLKGSGGMADMTDNIFIVHRNKTKESAMNGRDEKKIEKHKDKPDAYVKCEKQRVTGDEPLVSLFYSKNSCQFLQFDSEPPKKYLF